MSTSLNTVHRLLSRLGDSSLFSIKAKRQESGRVVVRTAQKKVSVLIIPANVYTPAGGESFGRMSVAEDAILHTHKILYVKALITFCCAAFHAHNVDCLVEMLYDTNGKIAAYRFFFIDRVGGAAEAALNDDDSEMDVSDDDVEDDDGSEDGAIAAAGMQSEKKQLSFSEAMLAIVQRKRLTPQMAMDFRFLADDNVLLDGKSFLEFAASYCQNTDLISLPITALKWKDKGLSLHQRFTWAASEQEVKRHCNLPDDVLNEDKYVRRPDMSAGTEQSRATIITALMFEQPDRVLKLDTTTLLSPYVFCKLRRPDVDLAYSARMRNPALSEDADLLEQMRQSAAFGNAEQNDGDIVRRRPAYVIIRNTLRDSYAEALQSDGSERWEKLLNVWKQTAAHWNLMTMNCASPSCPGLSMSMRSWLSFVRVNFHPETYEAPKIPFSVDAGLISNFVLWMFSNLESYLFMLKQHSNFFKLYCMMLGCCLPRDNGRVLPFVCLLGQAMSSKSFLLDCIRQIFLEDTTSMVSSSTNKARTTGYEISFETVEVHDEGSAGFLQTATKSHDDGIQQRQELLKQILTSNDVSHQMASSKELPNRSKRKIMVKEVWEEYNQSLCMASNHVDQIDPAIRTRIHEEFFAPSRRSEKDVSSLQSAKRRGENDPVWKSGRDKFVLTMQQFQTFHNMVCAVMKSGVLPAFEFKCFDLYMKYVELRLKAWGISVPSPRTKERMQCLTQSLTILRCWLACYVYEGAIFYQQPPSFSHIDEWSRHVCSDNSEAVLQTIAMMSHSIIGENVAKGQALHILYKYLVSESCITRKYYASSIEDAKQMFTPGADPVQAPVALPDWATSQRVCSWKQLMTAQAEISTARSLKQKSPAHGKQLLDRAKERIGEGMLESVCSCTGYGNHSDDAAAQPLLEQMNDEVKAEEERCKDCRDCSIKSIKAQYVVLKQSTDKLATAVYNYWSMHSEFGEPMSEAELIRTFDTLAKETANVNPVFVLRTSEAHAGPSATTYVADTSERKTKQLVYSPIGKDRLCICLGAMLKSASEASNGGVCVEALLSACNHKYMEESTILLSVGSSIVEPQYPKVHKTAKTDKVFSQMLDSIGHVQARAMGVVPQARVFQQFDRDLEYCSKYVALKTLGLPASCAEDVRDEGRLSSMLQQRFKEKYGDAQTAEEFIESLKQNTQVITRTFSIE